MIILKGVKITNIVKKILKNKLSWFDHRQKICKFYCKKSYSYDTQTIKDREKSFKK